MEAFANMLLEVPLPASFFVIVMGSTRALGALFGLWGLYFVLGPAAMLRMVLAFVFAGPILIGNLEGFLDIAQNSERFIVLTVPLREFVIGFALGMLMSLPFISVLGAAMLIDQYRGDFSPGIQGPEGLTIGSYANLNVVMILFIFVEAGGFLVLISVLYQSYGVFPPAVPGLALAPGFGVALGEILQSVMAALVVFALPVIMILMLLEFGVSIIARLNEKLQMPAIDFLVKNLALVLLLPLISYGLIRMISGAIDGAPAPLDLALRVFGP